MELTQKQFNAALTSGLFLSDPEKSETMVPVKLAGGTLILNELLKAISVGKLQVVNPVLCEITPREQPELSEPNPEVAAAVSEALADQSVDEEQSADDGPNPQTA